MACQICGRNSCIKSFHSFEEQEEWETKTGRYAPDEGDIKDDKKESHERK
jgi:hypothetical protein